MFPNFLSQGHGRFALCLGIFPIQYTVCTVLAGCHGFEPEMLRLQPGVLPMSYTHHDYSIILIIYTHKNMLSIWDSTQKTWDRTHETGDQETGDVRYETWDRRYGRRCETGDMRQEKWESRRETADMRQETWDRRWDRRSDTGDRRLETWDRRGETWEVRQETWERRQQTGEMRQEMWDRRQEIDTLSKIVLKYTAQGQNFFMAQIIFLYNVARWR